VCECGTISVPWRRGGDDIDVVQRQRGVVPAVACRLCCGAAQPLVQLRRLPESQHIPAVGSDCRLEVFTVIGIVDPTDPP
jgi:hypothetical protein